MFCKIVNLIAVLALMTILNGCGCLDIKIPAKSGITELNCNSKSKSFDVATQAGEKYIVTITDSKSYDNNAVTLYDVNFNSLSELMKLLNYQEQKQFIIELNSNNPNKELEFILKANNLLAMRYVAAKQYKYISPDEHLDYIVVMAETASASDELFKYMMENYKGQDDDTFGFAKTNPTIESKIEEFKKIMQNVNFK